MDKNKHIGSSLDDLLEETSELSTVHLCAPNEFALAEGTKFDEGKPRMDLIPPELLTEVAKILTFGAKKYDDRNWEKGMDWGRCYGALQRHLNAWWAREGLDAETGESHLAHAACCIAFLIAYEKRGIGKDTRYKA